MITISFIHCVLLAYQLYHLTCPTTNNKTRRKKKERKKKERKKERKEVFFFFFFYCLTHHCSYLLVQVIPIPSFQTERLK